MNANASLIYPEAISQARISQRECAPMPSSRESGVVLPASDNDYSYSLAELTPAPRIAPPPSGGVSLVRLAAWLLPPSLVLGVVAWVVL